MRVLGSSFQDETILPDKPTDVYMKLIQCIILREQSSKVGRGGYRIFPGGGKNSPHVKKIRYLVNSRKKIWSPFEKPVLGTGPDFFSLQ